VSVTLTKIAIYLGVSAAVLFALGVYLGADCVIVGLVAVLALAALLKSIADAEDLGPPR
jgi:hypothetical protein